MATMFVNIREKIRETIQEKIREKVQARATGGFPV